MKSPEDLTALFRVKGLKLTPQRECIFRALHSSDGGHPTAETVHAVVRGEMPMVSLRTVYQTLNDLVAMGEIRQLQIGGSASRFDVTPHGHHHMVCDRCGAVRDLEGDFTEVRVPSPQRRGFAISYAEIVFHGVCEQCAADGH